MFFLKSQKTVLNQKLKSWKVPTSCHSAGSAINVCRVDEDANNYTMTGTNAKLTPIPQMCGSGNVTQYIYSMLTCVHVGFNPPWKANKPTSTSNDPSKKETPFYSSTEQSITLFLIDKGDVNHHCLVFLFIHSIFQ